MVSLNSDIKLVCSDISVPSTSTLASEVNISSLDVSSSVVIAVHQVMMSNDAHNNYNYVILPETKQDPLYFYISILLCGRTQTLKSSTMVDSGATSMFISDKYVARH
jgi:hypothetical protein